MTDSPTVKRPRVRAGGWVYELTGARVLRAIHRPIPEPGPGEIVVQPRSVGVCGTDLHIWRGRSDRLPIVLTHDGVAQVVSLGSGVPGPLAGDRIVVDPTDACGSCDPCLRGHPGVCTDGGYLGMTVDGLLAEAIALPASRAIPLPDAVDDASATVLEPVAIGHRILAAAATRGLQAGRCVIVGGGPLGLLVGCVLADSGWQVEIIEPSGSRRAVAERLGLTASVPEPGGGHPRASLVIETSAADAGTRSAIAAAAPGATLVLLGRSPASLSAAQILLNELDVLGVRGGSGYYPEAVASVAEGRVSPAAVIDARFSVAKANDIAAAFQAHESPQSPLRAVLTLS